MAKEDVDWYVVQCPRTDRPIPLYEEGSKRAEKHAKGTHRKCTWCPESHDWSAEEIMRLRPEESEKGDS
jgi:hypothetical protein